jgi:cell division protein ZapA (FtsZ GTPase activity inhibitor)
MPNLSAATTQRMGELHEEYLAEINGGRKSKSSGNQWDDPGDGRNHHDDPFNFCWDGKSTLSKSLSVTLDMIGKIREQAGGERPELGLRWYGTGDLTKVLEDWIAVPGPDFQEMKLAAGDAEELRAATEMATRKMEEFRQRVASIGEEMRIAMAALATAEAALAEKDREIGQLQLEAQVDRERIIPVFVPRLPWVTIHTSDKGGIRYTSAIRYEADGRQMPIGGMMRVRVERSPDNRPRLFLDELRIRNGDLYQEGHLVVRACADSDIPEIG